MFWNKKANKVLGSVDFYGFSDGGIGFHGDDPMDRSGMVGSGTDGVGRSDPGGLLSDWYEQENKRKLAAAKKQALKDQKAALAKIKAADAKAIAAAKTADEVKAMQAYGDKWNLGKAQVDAAIKNYISGQDLSKVGVWEGAKRAIKEYRGKSASMNLKDLGLPFDVNIPVETIAKGVLLGPLKGMDYVMMGVMGAIGGKNAGLEGLKASNADDNYEASGTGSTHRSALDIDATSELPDEWRQRIIDFQENGTIYSENINSDGTTSYMPDDASNDVSNMSWEDKLQAYDMTSINSAMQAIKDVDTDVQYQHTLADLSGIGMDANEKALLDAQKGIAIDRAITEIEDTFAPEGESIIAQQIHNLGTNALGGTVGQGFVKRWQDREASAKTNALQDIESTYLAAERQGIDTAKQRQMDIWGKEYESDVKSAELGLDKTKAGAGLQYEWDRSYLDRLAQMRGQDITAEQQNLDRLLKERMGNQEYEAWEDSNMWTGIGGVVGSVAGSDWFGDVASSWFS